LLLNLAAMMVPLTTGSLTVFYQHLGDCIKFFIRVGAVEDKFCCVGGYFEVDLVEVAL
jgi:hypothetical protein